MSTTGHGRYCICSLCAGPRATVPLNVEDFLRGIERPPRPEPPPVERATRTVAIVGRRTWAVTVRYPSGALLTSGPESMVWPGRQRFEAKCLYWDVTRSLYGHLVPSASPWPWVVDGGNHPGEPGPVVGCTCGIYALSADDDIDVRVGHIPHVVGSVSLWGRVIEHEKGYRAQYAYPRELALIGGTELLRGALEFAYGVPVERW